MRVASYNVAHGAYAGYDFSRIADDINAVGADIVGIQELDQHTERCDTDSIGLIAKAAGFPYYEFAAAMDFKGGQYGVGVISKTPIKSVSRHPLPVLGVEPRVCMCCDMGEFYFLNTHIAYENTDATKAHLAAIAQTLKGLSKPFILTGDFNTEDFSLFGVLGDVALANNAERKIGSFYPKGSAIDNVIISEGARFTDVGMYDKTKNSDHHLFYAEVQKNG